MDDESYFCPWCGYGPQDNPTEPCDGPTCDKILGDYPVDGPEAPESQADHFADRSD